VAFVVKMNITFLVVDTLILQTYRPKDRERMILFLDEVQIDTLYLDGVLERHGLLKKWHEFRRRYDEK